MYLRKNRWFPSDYQSVLLDAVKRVDIAPGPGGSRISEPIKGTCIDWGTVRAIALYPSSQIVAHKDPPIPGTRYHLPLQLNPGCWVFSDGLWQQLEVGVLYEMDPSLLHGAVNWGAEVRIHLMIDTPTRVP